MSSQRLTFPNLSISPTLVVVFFATVVFVLVPFFIWGEALEQWANGLLAKTDSIILVSAAVIVLLAADILLPLPSSLIALGAGIKLGIGFGALSVFCGLMIGNLVGYALGRHYGARFAKRMVGSSTELPDHISGAFVCVTRAVPVLAEAIVVTAGAARLPLRSFLPAIALGNLGFAICYCLAGQFASTSDSIWMFFLVTMIGPVIGYCGFILYQRRKPA